MQNQPMKYYEDYTLNAETVIPVTYSVTEEEVIAMSAKWDPQPFHMDKEAAAKSIFGGLIASSAHLIPMFIWLGQQEGMKTAAIAGLGFDEMRMLAPVRPGDVLHYRYITIEKRLSKSRPGVGIIANHGFMYNQRDELVISSKVAVLVAFRPET